MHAARETGIEAAHRTHDVDALECVRSVLLEDGRILDGVFVWPRCPIDVARVGVPRRRRIRMVVCYLAFADNEMVRKDAANGFMESTADGFVGNFEWRKGGRASGVHFFHRFIKEMKGATRGVSLEIGASPVAFDCVAPLRYFPFKLDFAFERRFRQPDLHALPSRFDVANVD